MEEATLVSLVVVLDLPAPILLDPSQALEQEVSEPVDLEALKRDILEGTEYLVVGIVMPPKQRYAEWERADSPRQAEDLARAAIKSQVANGQHGELWVAGVIELTDKGMHVADTYAAFVDPDEERIQ